MEVALFKFVKPKNFDVKIQKQTHVTYAWESNPVMKNNFNGRSIKKKSPEIKRVENR